MEPCWEQGDSQLLLFFFFFKVTGVEASPTNPSSITLDHYGPTQIDLLFLVQGCSAVAYVLWDPA